jgi:hypothetical protein
MSDFHPLVKQLLDGELKLADLPPELRAEGEEALRLLSGVDHRPMALPDLTERVMSAIQGRSVARRSVWRGVGPWQLASALAVAAALVLWIGTRAPLAKPGLDARLVTVRFVLLAPDAQRVSVAGTFNQWDPLAAPLARAGSGVWTATLTLPAGQHQYAFVVDGASWIPDPAAPAIDDGFGRHNSVLAL